MAHNTTVSADLNAPPITQILAKFVATHSSHGWDESVEREAHRTFMNWVGCAIGASRHATAEAALAAVRELEPAPQASILGRSERVDMASAALVNGITSHTFDFDDTHLKTIIHPAGPVASAALALAEHRGLSGRELVDAIVLGVDVECRIGNMIYPDHYDRGWHITSSTGMLGAAAACARLLRLDANRTTMALGIAASQPIGFREQFGSMTKPFHPGGAARAGLMSAILAAHGYTASNKAIEAPRGMAQSYSAKHDWREITDGLGERFEISFNTYKPFACGIVIHPVIDGCVQLRNAHGLAADDIDRVEVKVHPLVLELTGKRAPQLGLEGKFSVYHAAAAGIIFGQAGEAEFGDEIVRRPDVIALRDRITAIVDREMHEDQADVTVHCRDGRELHAFVEHAIGSVERPMSHDDLARKFHGLVDPILGAARASEIIDACMRVAAASSVRDVV
ncbi:MAG TPA: MmgE/PrpD family protein, partial [Casimicrobiaceae bacterium]|nr:MmgE/PrpD family protein [Casimicrobiaceae bacterium]